MITVVARRKPIKPENRGRKITLEEPASLRPKDNAQMNGINGGEAGRYSNGLKSRSPARRAGCHSRGWHPCCLNSEISPLDLTAEEGEGCSPAGSSFSDLGSEMSSPMHHNRLLPLSFFFLHVALSLLF